MLVVLLGRVGCSTSLGFCQHGLLTRAAWPARFLLHARIPQVPPLPQVALARQQPVQYNKENPLNPFFVVYGKRK